MNRLLVFFSLFINSFLVYAQQEVYVETRPDSYLYAVHSYTNFPAAARKAYYITDLKSKKLRRATLLKVVGFTNVKKALPYDAYVVEYSGKKYIIKASDIVDNSLLDNKNKELNERYETLRDSVNRFSAPVLAYDNLLSVVDRRIDKYKEAERLYSTSRDSIVLSLLKKKMNEEIDEYKARREKYYAWVSSLPFSVQKDAKVLAIPVNEISVGYYGTCEYTLAFVNLSPKTIKYLYWYGKVKNTVGDFVSCEVRHTSSFSGKYTGPCEQYEEDYGTWDGILYNSSASKMILTSVKVIYTDGTSTTISKQSLDVISNIPSGVMGDSVNLLSLSPHKLVSTYEGVSDEEIEKGEFMSHSRQIYVERVHKEMMGFRDTVRLYEKARGYIIEYKENPSLMETFLSKERYIGFMWDDYEYKHAVLDYINAKENDDELTRRYKLFKKNNFVDVK